MAANDLIFYTRAGCHLCDRLEAMLAPHLRRTGLALNKRDIATNEAWHHIYGDRIPVVMHDNRVILEGRPEQHEVDAAMKTLTASPSA